ncbi:flagellar FliL protein [Sphingomonas sp. OV641]|uniref:flagellar basal body-associated FliL family protein n=1 Tax=Sphingomonas sp. OV641 TaxID=1881068 RepID=UPI0008C3ADFE|nr:flagellar basal body-associated FliL family protein [Sphingomonas sp. OV641]SEI77546.1 flagellar FliL protein [Sphingomonas sp. OV641]
MSKKAKEEATVVASETSGRFGKKKIIIAAAGAFLLLGGAGGAYAVMGGSAQAEGHGEQAAAADHAEAGDGESAEAEFVDVPPMVVNLRSADGAARFIKLHFMLVPASADKAEGIKTKLPLILDAYQPFLRELRPEDLAGSAAVYRIKEEMLVRAGDVLGRGQVKDVLIQDLIQQ